MSGTPPEPGWYDAPDGQRRWWDGTEWGPADESGDQATETKEPSVAAVLIGLALMGLIIFGGCSMVFGSSDDTPTGPRPADEFDAYDVCRQIVRRQVGSSGDFPPPRDATIRRLDGDRWSVAAWVDVPGTRRPWTCTAELPTVGSWTGSVTLGG